MKRFRLGKNSDKYFYEEGIGKVKIDRSEFIDGVPVSSTMEIGLKIRETIREIKYRVKHIVK